VLKKNELGPSGNASVQPAEEAMPPRLASLWRHLRRWRKVSFAALTTLSTTIFVLWLALLVTVATFRRHSLDLEAIAVPKALADDGFTPEVAAERLRDAIRDVQDSAQTSMRKQDVEEKTSEVGQASTEITIPKAGVSIENAAASLRRLLPEDWQNEVSGEFTSSESALSMLVRLNGRVVYSGTATGPNAATPLTKDAAFALVEQTQPFIAAISLYDKGEIDEANASAMKIVETLPPTDENVSRAYNLLGLIAKDRGDDQREEAFLTKAPDSSVARDNLGILRERQHRQDDAIDEIREALRLNPNDPQAHYFLGEIWRAQHYDDSAISEFREATRLSPNWALPHLSTGVILLDHHEASAALDEFREAMRLDPKSNISPFYTGKAALDLAKDSSLSQTQKVIALIDACDGFTHAAELHHPDAVYYQRQVNALKVPGTTCPRPSGQILTAKK
jgi:tetratricopeptide (TPR) repeat protein